MAKKEMSLKEAEAIVDAPDEKEEVSGKAFDVFNKAGGFVRTYSVERHGTEAVKLAEEYAAKIHGKVQKH